MHVSSIFKALSADTHDISFEPTPNIANGPKLYRIEFHNRVLSHRGLDHYRYTCLGDWIYAKLPQLWKGQTTWKDVGIFTSHDFGIDLDETGLIAKIIIHGYDQGDPDKCSVYRQDYPPGSFHIPSDILIQFVSCTPLISKLRMFLQ